MKNIFTILIFSFLASMGLAQGDDCANATPLACGDALVGQLGSTDNSDDILAGCAATMGAPVWYTFVGTGDEITISVDDTVVGWDAELGIYEAACGGADGTTCVAGNDDPPEATFTSTVGTVYLVAVGSFITGDPSMGFDITVACAPPPPPCPDGFDLSTTGSYCYDSNEVDVIVTEVCPPAPTETICITLQVADWEVGFDNLTFYEGATGTGTGGTVVAGPLDGDLSGTAICTTTPGACLTMVSNSDGSISCVSDSRPTAEWNVCTTAAVGPPCDATHGDIDVKTVEAGN